MLEKLATYDVQEVSELFSLADKCARAAEGHAWHSQPAPEAGKASKLEADAATQSNRKKQKQNEEEGRRQQQAARWSTHCHCSGYNGWWGPWPMRQQAIAAALQHR
jgi:hypothetical protein